MVVMPCRATLRKFYEMSDSIFQTNVRTYFRTVMPAGATVRTEVATLSVGFPIGLFRLVGLPVVGSMNVRAFTSGAGSFSP